jgi:hypothetical protein
VISAVLLLLAVLVLLQVTARKKPRALPLPETKAGCLAEISTLAPSPRLTAVKERLAYLRGQEADNHIRNHQDVGGMSLAGEITADLELQHALLTDTPVPPINGIQHRFVERPGLETFGGASLPKQAPGRLIYIDTQHMNPSQLRQEIDRWRKAFEAGRAPTLQVRVTNISKAPLRIAEFPDVLTPGQTQQIVTALSPSQIEALSKLASRKAIVLHMRPVLPLPPELPPPKLVRE